MLPSFLLLKVKLSAVFVQLNILVQYVVISSEREEESHISHIKTKNMNYKLTQIAIQAFQNCGLQLILWFYALWFSSVWLQLFNSHKIQHKVTALLVCLASSCVLLNCSVAQCIYRELLSNIDVEAIRLNILRIQFYVETLALLPKPEKEVYFLDVFILQRFLWFKRFMRS